MSKEDTNIITYLRFNLIGQTLSEYMHKFDANKQSNDMRIFDSTLYRIVKSIHNIKKLMKRKYNLDVFINPELPNLTDFVGHITYMQLTGCFSEINPSKSPNNYGSVIINSNMKVDINPDINPDFPKVAVGAMTGKPSEWCTKPLLEIIHDEMSRKKNLEYFKG